MPMLGQFDPVFTGYMNEVMALSRQVWRTENHWSLLVDGTARAAIEAISGLADRTGRPRAGAGVGAVSDSSSARSPSGAGADVRVIETEWGTVFAPDRVEDALRRDRPKLVAAVHGGHIEHHGPAARRDRPAVPALRGAVVRRRHGDARRDGAAGRRMADRRRRFRSPEVPLGALRFGAHHLQRAGGRGAPSPAPHRAGASGRKAWPKRRARRSGRTISTCRC